MLLDHVPNNMQAGPNINEERMPGWRDPRNFIIVSDPYPTVSALAADLILPTAMWIRRGAYGNAERRTSSGVSGCQAPGEAKSDLWQLVQFSRRFKTEEVWPEELLAKKPELRGKTLYEVLYATPEVSKFPVSELAEDQLNDESRELGFYCPKKGCSKSTHGLVSRITVTISRRSMTTTKRAVCAGRW